MNVRDILAKNTALKTEAQQLWDAASQGTGFSAEQKTRYEAIKTELARNSELVNAAAEIASFGDVKAALDPKAKSEESGDARASKEYEVGYKKFVASRGRAVPEILAANVSEADFKSGGVLLPTTFEQQVITLIQNDSVMRQLATVIPTTDDLPFPVESAKGSAAGTDEAPGTAGSNNYHQDDPTYAIKKLTAYKITESIPVSEELFQDYGAFQPYVVGALGRNIAEAEEAWFVSGTGSNQPQGVVGAATAGKTSASATTIDFVADLNDVIGALKSGYLNGAAWLMNRKTKAALRKAISTTGQPLWPANDALLLGYPVYLSDEMPDVATGAKPVLFGNFKRAVVIGDRGGLQTRILDQVDAKSGLIDFIGKRRVDQIVVLPEAIKALVMS